MEDASPYLHIERYAISLAQTCVFHDQIITCSCADSAGCRSICYSQKANCWSECINQSCSDHACDLCELRVNDHRASLKKARLHIPSKSGAMVSTASFDPTIQLLLNEEVK